MTNCIARIRYKNGVRLEVYLYEKPVPGKHDSDRIKVKIVPVGSKTLVIYMHALEAVDLIHGLSRAVGDAITLDLPLSATD